MNSITKFATAGAPKEVAPRTFRFVASTGERDRDGDVIEPSGWKLESYLRNPVILLGHDYGSAPVARASRVAVERGRLMVDVQFPSEGASEASDEAYSLVAEGFMRAVSVGFRALEREPMADGRGFRFTSVELLEVSLVSVPANASALLAARLGGKGEHEPVVITAGALRELLTRADAAKPVLWLRPSSSTPAPQKTLSGAELREYVRQTVPRAVKVGIAAAVGKQLCALTGALDAEAALEKLPPGETRDRFAGLLRLAETA